MFLGRSVLKRRFGGRHGGLGRRGRRLAERGSDENAPRVAANAEAAVGAEMAVAVENRQAGKFDGQPFVGAVHRPVDGDPAPGIARGYSLCDLAVRIDAKLPDGLAPGLAECLRRARAGEADEILGLDG